MIPKRRKPQRMAVHTPQVIRSRSHLQWVRGHECAIAGRAGHQCTGRIEAAHVRRGTDGGTGLKPSDTWAIPLCSAAHREQHQIGELAFAARYGIDLKAIAAGLARRSPHRAKWENRQ